MHNTRNSMAFEQPRRAFGKVSVVFATKLKSFTFLPALKKLPTEHRLKSVWEKESSESEALTDHGVSEGKTKDDSTYKPEFVHAGDMDPQEIAKHSETQQTYITKSSIEEMPTPTVNHAGICYKTEKSSPGTLDTADKHPRTPQPRFHPTGAEVISGALLNSELQREEEVLSPVSSVDIFTSPFSSKESILSEGWEQDTGWSALQMLSPSGSVSPCSSVRSGAFTPSVIRIKCHTLAPGASLMQMPVNPCQTHSCNKHITSPCPLSTRPRHRPPPTHLSLLTAILRKGRLPVLSSALQRPYSPCWPISPVNMSSCIACSAASVLAPMAGLRAKSCVSKAATCTEPSCKVRLKPLGLITKTEPASPMDQNKGNLPLTVVDPSDSEESNMYAAGNTISSLADGRSTLKLSSNASIYLPAAQSCKGIPVSTDQSLLVGSSSSSPIPFSPESTEEPPIQENQTYVIARHIKPCQIPPSELKPVQMTHKQSHTPDYKPIQQNQEISTSPVPKYSVDPGSRLQYHSQTSHEQEKIHSVSPVHKWSPSPRVSTLTHSANTPPISPGFPTPRPDSCSTTSDRYTLSSSPAIPYHLLSPSPSYSLCSSPTSSLRTNTPDSKKAYKIKSTYKALAAIPTNTLLLEQQAIDDEVNKNNSPLDPSDSFAFEDPHSQLCSPAQLRQQSAELYQVIDDILKDTNQIGPSSPVHKLTGKSMPSQNARKLTPSPRCLGRETKYANFHHYSASEEKTMTKPGVIRPAPFISRVDDKEKSCLLNTFQRQQDNLSPDHQYKLASGTLSTKDEAQGRGDGGGVMDSEKYMPSSTLKMTKEISTPSLSGTSS